MRHLLTVIAILLVFACCTTEADRNRMRAELDSINQRNRNDQPFTAADVQPCSRPATLFHSTSLPLLRPSRASMPLWLAS